MYLPKFLWAWKPIFGIIVINLSLKVTWAFITPMIPLHITVMTLRTTMDFTCDLTSMESRPIVLIWISNVGVWPSRFRGPAKNNEDFDTWADDYDRTDDELPIDEAFDGVPKASSKVTTH